MTEPSRRRFLQTTSFGAVAVGGAVLAPNVIRDSAPPQVGPDAAGPLPTDPVVAYVKDLASGEVAVLVGESEVVYRDHDLAKALARIATHAQA
jgi:Rieske Fe-S protein